MSNRTDEMTDNQGHRYRADKSMTYFQYFLSQQQSTAPAQINNLVIRDTSHFNNGDDETQMHSSAASDHFQQDMENHASSMKDTRSDNQTADQSSKSTRYGIISRPTPYPFGNTLLLSQSSSASRPISISDCSEESASTSTIAGASSSSPPEFQSSPESTLTCKIGYSDENASNMTIAGAFSNPPPELNANVHPAISANEQKPPPNASKRSNTKKRRRVYDQEANKSTLQIFRVILWPKLESLGWTKNKQNGCRECDTVYYPPGVSAETTGIKRRGVRKVLEFLASNNYGHLIDQASELYKLCQEQKSQLKAATLLPDDVQLSWIASELTKNRSEFANWNIPRVSPSTDWGIQPAPPPAEETSSENLSRKSGRVRVPSRKFLASTSSSNNGSEDHDGSHDSDRVSSQNTSSNKQVTSSVAWLYYPKAEKPDVITVYKHVMWPRLQALGWKEKTKDDVTYYILPGVDMTKQYCLYNRHYFDQVPDILRCVKKQWSKNEQAILSMKLFDACQQELRDMEKSGTLSEQVNFDLLMKKVQKSKRK